VFPRTTQARDGTGRSKENVGFAIASHAPGKKGKNAMNPIRGWTRKQARKNHAKERKIEKPRQQIPWKKSKVTR